MATSSRERILDATVEIVSDRGMDGFSLEEVASAAGVARATIYRQFVGGRDQLLNEAVTREVGRFWAGLADHVRHLGPLRERLVQGLMEANRTIRDHELLQRLLVTDTDDLMSRLSQADGLARLVLTGYLRDLLLRETLRDGVDVDEAAQYLARMIVAYMSTPGRWDLTDEAQVSRLVDTQFLAGVVDDG